MSRAYLVDTDVISGSAPSKAQQLPGLASWMDRNSDKLFVSVVTIAEIEDGIAKLRREGAHRKAAQLAEWLDTLLHLYNRRILSFDLAAARTAGALSDLARAAGHAPGFADIAIAAIAKQNGLIILTRNQKHFVSFGVPLHDPYLALA